MKNEQTTTGIDLGDLRPKGREISSSIRATTNAMAFYDIYMIQALAAELSYLEMVDQIKDQLRKPCSCSNILLMRSGCLCGGK
jgi:hypothetical protein